MGVRGTLVIPAQAGIHTNGSGCRTIGIGHDIGLGPSLRWGDGFGVRVWGALVILNLFQDLQRLRAAGGGPEPKATAR